MTDLVDRLRATDGTVDITTILDRCNEAANEIDRLRRKFHDQHVQFVLQKAEIDQLRAQRDGALLEAVRLRAALGEPKP